MVLSIIYIVLALGIDGVIFYFTSLYNYPYFYWVPVIAFPILYVLLFAVTLIFLFIWGVLINKSKEIVKPNKFYMMIVSQVVHQVNFFAGCNVKKSGFGNIPHGTPYLIIYNHVSNFDPMLIMDHLHKDKIICISKPSNFKIPIAGPFVYKAGYISINREDPKEGTKAILKAVDFANMGYTIAIAPEGTRMKDGVLGDFHPGSFQIGYHAQIPIVLIGFKNTKMIHKNFPLKRTKINMDVIDVIPYESYKDKSTVALTKEVRELYQSYLNEGE